MQCTRHTKPEVDQLKQSTSVAYEEYLEHYKLDQWSRKEYNNITAQLEYKKNELHKYFDKEACLEEQL